ALATMWLLRDYDYLLANLWEENIRLQVIEETTGLTNLHRTWQQICPFITPQGETSLSLPIYRRQRFEHFCTEHLQQVGTTQRRQFERVWNSPERQQQREHAIRTYQQQLSIRTFLSPDEYSEKRTPIRASDLHIGIIHRGSYYLIPVVDPTSPTAPAVVYNQVSAILHAKNQEAQLDLELVTAPRASQPQLRKLLSREQRQAIEQLQHAPILINWDQANRDLPLTIIRNQHRGIGDHALTLFRTNQSMVFDFSHIYFDGPWAMQIAEMLTNEAVQYLHKRDAIKITLPQTTASQPLNLETGSRLQRALQKFPPTINYVSAENSADLAPINDLRKILAQRTKPTVKITVNDLLVLYRTIFNQRYQPGNQLLRALNDLRKHDKSRTLTKTVDDMFVAIPEINPSLMIPIDASRFEPRERIFPSTFRSPLIDFRHEHDHVIELLNDMNSKLFRKGESREIFLKSREKYLGTLSVFGEVMRRYRAIAIQGESMSTTAIRLIAGLPGAMQRLMDGLPGHFDFMNEAIKGEEVFSNVGQVTPGSSLSRFSSAKDDNDKKVLVWGIMTDNQGILHLTLRDFRPQVRTLAAEGHIQLARLITQDFLDAYLRGFITFINEVNAIITASGSK
ncbi:MAG: choline/carnitine O-acyltransferase, partial [Anaerolineae bacterium]|nr:choline/carnitine O-acyltransferase [Anaerolineae bacterium]